MQYWDIAKGITILLVIMGHIPEVNLTVQHMIYTYHMPFFFIANAYFIKHYDLKSHFRKSAKTLLLPYGVVCILQAICYGLRGNNDVYYDYEILRVTGERISGKAMNFWNIFVDKIADMFVGLSFHSNYLHEFESIWIVWFVICLFAGKMVYVSLMQGLSLWLSGKGNGIIRGASLLLCLLFSGLGMWIGQRFTFLPWSFDISLGALPFFWIGEELRKSGILEKKHRWLLYGASFLLWVLLFLQDIYMEMAFRIYPGYVLSLIVAAAGSLVVIGISQFIEKYLHFLGRFFAWCGEHSIVLLGVHCLEHRFFDWNKYVYGYFPMEVHWIGLFFLHSAVIVAVSFLFVKLKEI